MRSGDPLAQSRPGDGARRCHLVPDKLRTDLTGGGRHPRPSTLFEHDDQGAGVDERPAALHDQLQHPLEIGLRADRAGDHGRRLEPAHRPLQLRVPCLQRGIEAGVVDRDCRPVGQHHDGLHVALVELHPALLVGEVEVAEGLVANPDRHAQECLHRRVLGWKSVRAGMRRHVVQAQRLRMADQLAEHPVPAR